ncbi:phosphotransferase enzyme family protein [Aureibacillus halotolerans]|uniref:Ser/Thr protein kinase RdoA (MazF antagonist) n=1 Tax=Aureibacillus halotolerans TaxID=1508390 RepID=A0A4R6TT10_9BACI|nr:phosphotransferase [Aureibacillus halotolerans]TDQ33711.1 Ser/Thr protein kinase RdoA (MazF antagonist) [Aureibacillus halotolerans]
MAKFTDFVVSEAASRYGVQLKDLNLLGSHQNVVYGYSREGREYILRITHKSHRSQELIQGELDWISYLSMNGVLVSRPICSNNGLLIESLMNEDEGFFFVAFEKALGDRWTNAIFQDEEFKRHGTVVAKMHALSKSYKPGGLKTRRLPWNKSEYLTDFIQNVPSSQRRVISHFNALMRKLEALPRDSESFGLIHGDFCYGNYFIQADGSVTVFDFDECQYGWFVQDIAVNLF